MPGLTPRKVLQWIGTDVMRKSFHDDIWIKSLKKKITILLAQGISVIVTDCRFPNEAEAIRRLGGKVILVSRKSSIPAFKRSLDLYYNVASQYYKGGFIEAEYLIKVADKMYQTHQVHPAETSLIGYCGFDHIITNDGTLDDLKRSTISYINSQTPAAILFKDIIAIDFDDVIVPFMQYFLTYCSGALQKEFQWEDIHTLIFSEILGVTPDAVNDLFDQFVNNSPEWVDLHNTKPSHECIEALTALKEQGHNLVIVTAREPRFEHVTRIYIHQYMDGLFDNVYFANCYSRSGEKKTKLQLCQQLGCKILVDDNYSYLQELINNETIGILFGMTPWNQNVQTEHRAVSWEQLVNVVNVALKQ
jgi:uncharacterized HAD superfamily protein